MAGMIKLFGIGLRLAVVANSQSTSGEMPATHPHKKFIEDAVAEEVKRQSGPGGGGSMSDLERRVGNLETDVRIMRDNLNSVSSDIAVIKANYATKSDISDIKVEIATASLNQTRWMIGTMIAVIGLVIAIQKLIPANTESSSRPVAPQVVSQPQNSPPASSPPTK